jgi:transcriptional regulator with XRE-family HTH domain
LKSDTLWPHNAQERTIEGGKLPAVTDGSGWKPMNALQQLIADYLADHPGENLSTIARRGGLSRQTVQGIARRSKSRQTPQVQTLEGLAKGMNKPISEVRAAAGIAAGFGGTVTSEIKSDRGRLIAEALSELSEERLEFLARRARLLLEEQRQEQGNAQDSP